MAVATSEAALRISLSQGSTGKKTRHMKDSVIMRRLEATAAQSNEQFESKKGAVGYLSSVWGDEGDPFDAYVKAPPSAEIGDDVSPGGHNHIVDDGDRKIEDSKRENPVENGDGKESQDVFLKTEDATCEPLLSSPKLAWIPSLSVQQLIDCDNSFNKGCSGGSPLIALHYISDNGLVPWSRYEYEEQVSGGYKHCKWCVRYAIVCLTCLWALPLHGRKSHAFDVAHDNNFSVFISFT